MVVVDWFRCFSECHNSENLADILTHLSAIHGGLLAAIGLLFFSLIAKAGFLVFWMLIHPLQSGKIYIGIWFLWQFIFCSQIVRSKASFWIGVGGHFDLWMGWPHTKNAKSENFPLPFRVGIAFKLFFRAGNSNGFFWTFTELGLCFCFIIGLNFVENVKIQCGFWWFWQWQGTHQNTCNNVRFKWVHWNPTYR